MKGILRGSSLRLWPTSVITMRVCSLGLATIGLLEALAGSWVALLGVRQRLFSIMDVVFECWGVQDQKAVVRLSPELIEELISLVLLGPLACINFRAQPCNFVTATDASMDAVAAVSSPCPSAVVGELLRYCLRKGAWSKLLPLHLAWLRQHDLLAVTSCLCNPLWETIARSLPYTTTWMKQVTSSRHINILEMQAFIKEEKRLCEKHCRVRIPFGIDSQVCLGALVKGRASSSSLNNLLRQSMAYPVGADVYEGFMYFPTQHNRADRPTRGSNPKPPDLEQPAWMLDLPGGSCSSFDEWMWMHCPHLCKPEVPIQNIAGLQDVDLRPNSRVRMMRKFAERKLPIRPSARHPVCEKASLKPSTSCTTASPSAPSKTRTFRSVLCKEAIAILESIPAEQFFLFR